MKRITIQRSSTKQLLISGSSITNVLEFTIKDGSLTTRVGGTFFQSNFELLNTERQLK